ncbi:hypothetical protein A8E97_12920 [Burkholderia cenocepacia]|nr:hypothetical protein A8E88_29475 [Burkholderia cenocepacia]ONV79328.1 hypothetical protein A8E89_34465 [Burkholderia cenocepacia]ONW18844.1 hypothetical protein A8E90_13010 [Burkholderia cenocepacia]ONW19227.1 hypothetical protein A8E94_07290 [Burkholderia cenocepacia]ONW36349.1 hypothetical protein A8E93_24200 [Burkholderia cenocepacia]
MRTMRFSCVSGAMNCRFSREKVHGAIDTAHDDSFVGKILKRDRNAGKSAIRPIRRVLRRGKARRSDGNV